MQGLDGYATQSTHKLLAGLSQASQILVQDAEHLKLDFTRFNEAYLMHTSTSPQYAIIASCDVAAAMMEQPAAARWWRESISEALDFRRAMAKVDKSGKDWWFKDLGPTKFALRARASATMVSQGPPTKWHGFGNIAARLQHARPDQGDHRHAGAGRQWPFRQNQGIPASLVTKYLAEHGVVVEKTGLYSFFVMFTIGITKGRWNSLVTELQQFKMDYDQNQPLWRVMPEFVHAHPQYERVGLRDLCAAHPRGPIAIRRRPRDHRDVSVADGTGDEAERCVRAPRASQGRPGAGGRTGRPRRAMLVTPCPPGIPLLLPGERFNKTIVDYLKFARGSTPCCLGLTPTCMG